MVLPCFAHKNPNHPMQELFRAVKTFRAASIILKVLQPMDRSVGNMCLCTEEAQWMLVLVPVNERKKKTGSKDKSGRRQGGNTRPRAWKHLKMWDKCKHWTDLFYTDESWTDMWQKHLRNTLQALQFAAVASLNSAQTATEHVWLKRRKLYLRN